MTIKLKSLLKENNILVPRNLDSREKQRKQIDFQRIQEYINNGSEGDLDLRGTPLTKLPDNLTKVDEVLNIIESNIEDLNNLEYVGEYLFTSKSKLRSLPPKLTRIGRGLSLTGCPIDNIDNLKYVGGNLLINGTKIDELPKGLVVGGWIYYVNTPLSRRFPDQPSLEKHLKERNIIVKGGIIT